MQQIDITQYFPFPLEQLFEHLAEHENLQQIFAPAKVTRLRDGDNSRNGVGSVRLIKLPLVPAIEETNTLVENNQRIEYRITNKAAVKDHLGVMRFASTDGGSRLHYTIEFAARIPLTGLPIKLALQQSIRKGLKRLALRSL